jgi:hypothetical protein
MIINSIFSPVLVNTKEKGGWIVDNPRILGSYKGVCIVRYTTSAIYFHGR